MTWTVPTTRTTGEKITDSIWNIELVDNLKYLYDGYLRYACVADVKANTTAGGTFTSGAWRTRDLNTVINDSGSILSLAGNQITMPSGIYRCSISCPVYIVQSHQARLYDTTAAATLLVGSVERCNNAADYPTNRSFIVGQFTLTVASILEVQHICQVTRNVEGFGYPGSFAVGEVYTLAEFWKIG